MLGTLHTTCKNLRICKHHHICEYHKMHAMSASFSMETASDGLVGAMILPCSLQLFEVLPCLLYLTGLLSMFALPWALVRFNAQNETSNTKWHSVCSLDTPGTQCKACQQLPTEQSNIAPHPECFK